MVLNFGFHRRLVSWICLTLALSLTGCSEETSGGGENVDDKNVYFSLGDEANGIWDYEANTARDLSIKGLQYNIDFVCARLPFGYYRAMLTVADEHQDNTYSVFTLDADFNVVGYITPENYYVVTRSQNGYQLREAGEFKDELPQPGDGGGDGKKARPREQADYYKKVAAALIDFHQASKDYSTIEKADWREMLNRIMADDVKPVRSAPDNTYFAAPALQDYELDRIISDRLADVRTLSLHGISALVEGVESRNGKMEVHVNFSDHSYTTDDDFRNIRCGLLLYDFYDRHRSSPMWLEPQAIERYECTLVYDLPVGCDWTDYVVVPYLINADYVDSADPLVMFDDMAVKGTVETNTRLLPANSISIDKVYSEQVAKGDGNDAGEYIRVTGHAVCDVDAESSWTIDYAYLPKDYQLYGPKTPATLPAPSRNTAVMVGYGVKEVDFDVLIPVMKDMMEVDTDNFRASADLMLFISDGGNGLGDYTFGQWTYSVRPSVKFVDAGVENDHLSFSYECKGSFWFDPTIKLDGGNYYSGNLMWWLSPKSHMDLAGHNTLDGTYTCSNDYLSALDWLYLNHIYDPELTSAKDFADYGYFKYSVGGREYRSENALKFRIEDVEVPGGPFEAPSRVPRVTGVSIVR